MQQETPTTTFEVWGPFDIPRHPTRIGNGRLISSESVKELRVKLESANEGLSEACGCYVFALRASKGYRPWYVGQACKRSIVSEAMNASNIVKYNSIGSERGTPVLFLLPLMTPSGKFRKRQRVDGGLEHLDFLEDWLIATALQKNPKLINNKKTRHLRRVQVIGIMNSVRGAATRESAELKRALFRPRLSSTRRNAK